MLGKEDLMKTPTDFKKEVLGVRKDMDGFYGAQCWDGYAYYMKWLGYPYSFCTSTGYVKDIWNNRNINGMLTSCDVVTTLQKGDIVVFKEAPKTPYSHIAIFMADNGDGTGVFLGQNQGGFAGAFNEATFSYSGMLGAFRPNVYKDLYTKPTKTKYKIGTYVCTNTLSTSSMGGRVYKGDWEGRITRVEEGAKYPYLLNNGTGWTNDTGIDSDPHIPGGQKKSTDQIALEIFRGIGNWGNGQERIAKLKNAGYDPNLIQEKINALFRNKGKVTK
ncbi:MAG: CHAP domain-containing protein [Longicatena sp.]